MPDGAIARVPDCRFGKALVRGLEFLQANYIGSRFGQPFDQPGQAGIDSLDVESCDLPIRMPPIGRSGPRLFPPPPIHHPAPHPHPPPPLRSPPPTATATPPPPARP